MLVKVSQLPLNPCDNDSNIEVCVIASNQKLQTYIGQNTNKNKTNILWFVFISLF